MNDHDDKLRSLVERWRVDAENGFYAPYFREGLAACADELDAALDRAREVPREGE